jgi:hypothetical protein
MHHTMNMHGIVEAQLHIFLMKALDGGKWSAPCSSCFTPGKDPLVPTGWQSGTQSQSGCGSKQKNPCPCPEWNASCQSHDQSLLTEPSHFMYVCGKDRPQTFYTHTSRHQLQKCGHGMVHVPISFCLSNPPEDPGNGAHVERPGFTHQKYHFKTKDSTQ